MKNVGARYRNGSSLLTPPKIPHTMRPWPAAAARIGKGKALAGAHLDLSEKVLSKAATGDALTPGGLLGEPLQAQAAQ